MQVSSIELAIYYLINRKLELLNFFLYDRNFERQAVKKKFSSIKRLLLFYSCLYRIRSQLLYHLLGTLPPLRGAETKKITSGTVTDDKIGI